MAATTTAEEVELRRVVNILDSLLKYLLRQSPFPAKVTREKLNQLESAILEVSETVRCSSLYTEAAAEWSKKLCHYYGLYL